MKTELLERLSKAAPDWCKFWTDEFGRSTLTVGDWIHQIVKSPGHDLYLSKQTKAVLFGAICEKIETEGWDWLKQARNLQIIDPDNNYKIIASTRLDDGLLAALAIALYEALEAKQEVAG